MIGVIALAGVFWKRLSAQYCLRRLVADPGYLHEILDSPEGSARWLAIRSFLETRSGMEALFREYAGVVLEPVFAQREDMAATVLEAVIWSGSERACYVEWFPPRSLGSFGIRLKVDSPQRSVGMNGFLETLRGTELRLPKYADLRFEILPGWEALMTCPRVSKYHSIMPGHTDLTCLVRREPQAAVRAMIPLLEACNNITHIQEYLEALGEIGSEARIAVSTIRAVAGQKHRGEFVRKAADDALKRILPEG
jgi:hypothetical protein